MPRIALLDYGMGNLHSAAKALEHVGAQVDITHDPVLIKRADKIVFPGVGAMRDCMQGMKDAGIDVAVKDAVFNKPVLAICVGMQALMQHSQENEGVDCLGVFEGNVVRFEESPVDAAERIKVPHMGWNQVHQAQPAHHLWHNIAQDSHFYFVHSYYVTPKNKHIAAASCHYGLDFTCALHQDNLFAVQFHPEKSHTAGLQLLRNFVTWDI